MKAMTISFSQMCRQMKQDNILLIMAFVPFIIGIIFRFIIPVVEDLLTDYFGSVAILTPYYELFDLFLIIVTPAMLNFVVAMVMLEEADDHLIAYLAVTPLGKAGYLFSRLGITGLISFFISILVAALFQLSGINFLMMTGLALAGSIQGILIALLIVVLSKNKVEGLAIGKMTTLFNLGILAPYFVTGKVRYFVSVLPTFWMATAIQTSDYFSLLLSILLSLIWIAFLSRRFMKKTLG